MFDVGGRGNYTYVFTTFFTFLSCCARSLKHWCYVGVFLAPKIEEVSYLDFLGSVTLSYRPPAGTDPNKVVLYSIRRKMYFQDYDWESTKETTALTHSATGLATSHRYGFYIVARYRGESSTVVTKEVTRYIRLGTSTCI